MQTGLKSSTYRAQISRTFDVEACLGRGGFGEVYLARMTSPGGLSTRVALKVLHAGLDHGLQAVQRLRDEGRVLASLEHPVILQVRDVCVLDGKIALVTEYVEGEDLSTVFRAEGAIGPRALVQVVAQVAAALGEAAAARGPGGEPLRLVHRDIKPSNIRLGQHGQVKLLDFGIARSDEMEREARTATHMVIGTMGYMAPERFLDGRPHPASDVFALGVCLWEGLAGRSPLKAMGAQAFTGLAYSPERYGAWLQPALAALGRTWDRELVAVIGECLRYEPEDRPSADELARRLELLGDELAGPTLAAWARARSWSGPPTEDGPWVGLSFTEGTLSLGASAPATRGRGLLRWGLALLTVGGLGGVIGVLAVGVLGTAAVGGALYAGDLAPARAPAIVPAPVPAPRGQAAPPVELPVSGVASAEPAGSASALLPAASPGAERAGDREGSGAPTGEALSGSAPDVHQEQDPHQARVPSQDRGSAQSGRMSRFSVAGPVPARLQRGEGRWEQGLVPPGVYQILADFGSGEQLAGEIRCEPASPCAVRCNPLLMGCGAP
ncbi:MAG: protein kinase [Deltaproteobacteria bacterium]|nr:protein kinase [Deltaproteobacteria bacterium]